MRSVTPEQDLRAACIHESAHMIVARHLGVGGFIHIGRNQGGGATGEQFVGGRLMHYGGQFHPIDGQPDEQQSRLIGLAGSVAQFYDRDRDVPKEDIVGRLELSVTDEDMAAGFDEGDIERCLLLVQQLWGDIEAEAARAAAGSAADPSGLYCSIPIEQRPPPR
jgi:hypothetical protein